MVRKESIPDFDSWLSTLPDRLEGYPAPHIRLFIASCCERQQTNYAAFAEHVGWGDPTLLREAGDILWDVNQSLSDSYLRAIARALARATPSTDEFDSPLAPAAQEAAVSLQEGLDFLTDPDPQLPDVGNDGRPQHHLRHRCESMSRSAPISRSRVSSGRITSSMMPASAAT